jgi:hypothetical protein
MEAARLFADEDMRLRIIQSTDIRNPDDDEDEDEDEDEDYDEGEEDDNDEDEDEDDDDNPPNNVRLLENDVDNQITLIDRAVSNVTDGALNFIDIDSGNNSNPNANQNMFVTPPDRIRILPFHDIFRHNIENEDEMMPSNFTDAIRLTSGLPSIFAGETPAGSHINTNGCHRLPVITSVS